MTVGADWRLANAKCPAAVLQEDNSGKQLGRHIRVSEVPPLRRLRRNIFSHPTALQAAWQYFLNSCLWWGGRGKNSCRYPLFAMKCESQRGIEKKRERRERTLLYVRQILKINRANYLPTRAIAKRKKEKKGVHLVHGGSRQHLTLSACVRRGTLIGCGANMYSTLLLDMQG